MAAGGLLGLPIVRRRRARVLCAVVDGSGDESENDNENGKEISSVDGAASTVDPAVSGLRGFWGFGEFLRG